ncbi:MAG: WecB/TagA/CpsF family glycosyltransferase [Candidatus Aminicenantes bacterium]|nr:WecB/TagA/CpsF family glycosyltransferase [Candidatus Aminicenantes bacterium]
MLEISLWGIKIHVTTRRDLISRILVILDQRSRPIQLTGVNPETIIKSRKDVELRAAIVGSDFVNIDGLLVVYGLRFLGIRVPERCACPDLFDELMRIANQRQMKIYLLGTELENIPMVAGQIKREYPDIKICGYHHGYFSAAEEKSLVQEIVAARTDMLFVGMPTPQKETFIFRHREELNIPLSFGVGGVFDIKSGKTKRAPAIFLRLGLESLYRLCKSPRGVGGRVVKFYPAFLKLLLSTKMRAWREKDGHWTVKTIP